MTNYDKIKTMPIEELGRYFCDAVEIIGSNTKDGFTCDICPVEHLCKKGKNGFITWLESEEPIERR